MIELKSLAQLEKMDRANFIVRSILNETKSICVPGITTWAIDQEIEKLIKEAHLQAKKILTDKKKVLKAIVTELLDKEIMEHDEFYELIGEYGIEKNKNSKPSRKRRVKKEEE